MKRTIILSLSLALFLLAALPAGAQEQAGGLERVEKLLLQMELEPLRVQAEAYEGGEALRAGIMDGQGEILLAMKSETELAYLFYLDPGDYTVPENNRTAFLLFVNQMNSLQQYPTLFLSDYGYPAGHGTLTVPAQEEELEKAVQNALLVCEQALTLVKASPYFSAALPVPTPSPRVTAPVTSAPVPTGHIEYVYQDQICPNCHGTGDCPLCQGTGTYRRYGVSISCDTLCSYCGGNKTVRVLVPVWVEDER